MAEAASTADHKNLTDFYQSVLSKEPSVRLECFSALETFLSRSETSLDCDDLPGFINGLIKWIEGSNFRIAHNGLQVLSLLLDRLDSSEFGHYVEQVTTATVDRLGDAKDQVREAAADLLIKLMTTYTPQRIWDLIQPLAFDSKQFRIKEDSQRLLVRSLDEREILSFARRPFAPQPAGEVSRRLVIVTIAEVCSHTEIKQRSQR